MGTANRKCFVRSQWLGASVLVASSLMTGHAAAQTWSDASGHPHLGQVLTLDATGERRWPWGAEDVAGDGLGTFDAPEQGIDQRSAYASTDAQSFWFRVYQSSTEAPAGTVSAWLFVDADHDASTGGPATAPEVDALLDAAPADPVAAGFEFVLGLVGGDPPGTATLWSWNEASGAYVSVRYDAAELVAENGVSLDPLRLHGDDHGYLQAKVALTALNLTRVCDARFYLRSTTSTATLGDGDLDVGPVAECVPADANADGVPDVLQSNECQDSADCPTGSLCVQGVCVMAPPCATNADCAANEECVGGWCVLRTGTACQQPSDCDTGVCEQGRCVLCTADADCSGSLICGPQGACVSADTLGVGGAAGTGNHAGSGGTTVAPLQDGERIQGGACACRATAVGSEPRLWAIALLVGGLLLGRRRAGGEG